MSNDHDPSHDPYAERPANAGERPLTDNIYTQFIKEVCILLLGVMIGFAWSQYFREVSQEAHLVVALSIVVLCMVRFIYLMSRSREEG